jgi:hypothetical protein
MAMTRSPVNLCLRAAAYAFMIVTVDTMSCGLDEVLRRRRS